MFAYKTSLVAVLTVGALCAGCAGHRTKEAGYTREEARTSSDRRANEDSPTVDIARARTLIEQVEKSGGQQYAATELQSARSKIQLADTVRDSHKGSRKERGATARQQAEEAVADAELAVALSERGEAEKAASAVSAGTEALRRESVRQDTSDVRSQVPVRPLGVDR
ncbi:MAG: DUF4398 domain-containing protein [Gammaproteobacteria bacterium]